MTFFWLPHSSSQRERWEGRDGRRGGRLPREGLSRRRLLLRCPIDAGETDAARSSSSSSSSSSAVAAVAATRSLQSETFFSQSQQRPFNFKFAFLTTLYEERAVERDVIPSKVRRAAQAPRPGRLDWADFRSCFQMCARTARERGKRRTHKMNGKLKRTEPKLSHPM